MQIRYGEGVGDGDGVARPANPLSLATLASSPKGTPLGCAENFAPTTEAVPLGKVASPQAMTEGVSFCTLPQAAKQCIIGAERYNAGTPG